MLPCEGPALATKEPVLSPPSTTEMAVEETFCEELVAPVQKPGEQQFLGGDISFEKPGMCSSPTPAEDADATYEPSQDESYLR